MQRNYKAKEIDPFLTDLFNAVNRKHFNGSVQAQIVWEIPEGYIEEDVDEDATYSKVPAAGYYPSSNPVIIIHPALKLGKTPQYVLRYLIYHECAHQISPPRGQEKHHDDFMKLEVIAPHRQKAIRWLQEHNYPTMRINVG